ncbi:MAG: metal-sensitive transcriptional regulator [Anaerolineae bacterium]|nr:metal-sensitive transcriptional regulator [Anaerolineae bacterium]MDQ7036799.1 metal-sensitive transcriptional regulator [Anaerolineae bacterium]
MEVKKDVAHHDRTAHNKASLNRIRRIQGQLKSLERMIEADEGSCEDRVIRARTVEKGVASLISNMIECYIDNTIKYQMQTDPEQATEELSALMKLVNKYK